MLKVKRCGTAAPIWLSMPKDEMPIPGTTKSGSACVTWAPRGEYPECCPIRFPVEVKNCINFFVYKLTSTGGCDLAYCAEGDDMFLSIYRTVHTKKSFPIKITRLMFIM